MPKVRIQGKLWTALTRSRRVLPERYRGLNPEMQSLWPLLGLGVLASVVVLALLFYNILYFDPNRPDVNLIKFKPLQPVNAPGTPLTSAPNPSSPRFAEGVTVQVRRSGVIYVGPGINPLPESRDGEYGRGVVQDGLWQQGRWFYQIRFSPTRVGWVAEGDLEAAPLSAPDRPEKIGLNVDRRK